MSVSTPDRTGRRGAWIRSALGAGLALVVAASCASSGSPGQTIPELRTTLAAIDSAIADHRFGQARSHLTALVRTTIAARDSGQLEPEQAEPILAAAATLDTALPDRSPRAAQPDTGDGDSSDDKADEREKWREEQAKKQEEREKKREEKKKEEDNEDDGGNGHGSDNGPDDGHGN